MEGFAVSLSDPGYARSLASRRASAVVQFLRSLGINAFARLETSINLPGSAGQNRRAEVSITSRLKQD